MLEQARVGSPASPRLGEPLPVAASGAGADSAVATIAVVGQRSRRYSRAAARSSSWSSENAKSISGSSGLRQADDTLGDDVAQDLGRPGLDGVARGCAAAGTASSRRRAAVAAVSSLVGEQSAAGWPRYQCSLAIEPSGPGTPVFCSAVSDR